jgi:hypothetical protein
MHLFFFVCRLPRVLHSGKIAFPECPIFGSRGSSRHSGNYSSPVVLLSLEIPIFPYIVLTFISNYKLERHINWSGGSISYLYPRVSLLYRVSVPKLRQRLVSIYIKRELCSEEMAVRKCGHCCLRMHALH